MLRHPITHLQATYYDNDWSDYAEGRSFRYFIDNKYLRLSKVYDFEKNLPYRNIQMFFLGLQPSMNGVREVVSYRIDKIEQDFDVILFQEYMLESLVFLKHELNWAVEELVVFSLHSRPENNNLEELTEEVNATIILHNEGMHNILNNFSSNF